MLVAAIPTYSYCVPESVRLVLEGDAAHNAATSAVQWSIDGPKDLEPTAKAHHCSEDPLARSTRSNCIIEVAFRAGGSKDQRDSDVRGLPTKTCWLCWPGSTDVGPGCGASE